MQVSYKHRGGDSLAVFQEMQRLLKLCPKYVHVFLAAANYMLVNHTRAVRLIEQETREQQEVRRLQAEVEELRRLVALPTIDN